MTNNEIPAGTRAVMFCFNCGTKTPRVTFDLYGNGAGKTYSQMEAAALQAILVAGHQIDNFKAHFIN